MHNISPKRVISLIEKLSFPRSAGSKGEDKAFDIIKNELDKMGIESKYECFPDEWMELVEGYVKIQDKFLDIYPLINPIWSNQWMPIPQTIDCSGILNKSSEFISIGNEKGIVVHEACDINNPCLSGASAQLFPSDIDNEFVPYWCASKELIPSAWIDNTAGQLLEQCYGLSCKFFWSYRKTQKTFKNMIAEIPGSKRPDQIVVVGAHIDSFPGTVGADDNASGSARLIEFARSFAENPPLRTIRFVWFTGEELDRRGSQAYVRTHSKDLENTLFYLNVDGGVAKRHGEPTAIITAGNDDSIAKIVNRLKDISPSISVTSSIIEPDTQNASAGTDDAAAFNFAGIPTIYIKGQKVMPGPTPHLPTDTVGELDPKRILQIGSLALSILEKELNKENDIG
jgi:hypothetical protein